MSGCVCMITWTMIFSGRNTTRAEQSVLWQGLYIGFGKEGGNSLQTIEYEVAQSTYEILNVGCTHIVHLHLRSLHILCQTG